MYVAKHAFTSLIYHVQVFYIDSRCLCSILRKYKLPPSQIIPFTKRSDVSNAPDFPVGSQVLAVYPGTTALYKASVVGPQRKVRTP